MRFALAFVTLFATIPCFGTDGEVHATRVIEGQKTTFPRKSLPEGVKTLIGVLGSCHAMSDGTIKYSTDELKKALKGDHVNLVFARPVEVEVLRKKLKVSQAVFANGVFWLLCGNDVVRCTKYKHDKMDRFQEWYRQTLPVD